MKIRTVRHPITMFVLAVLAVIGIGVGALAGTGNGALSSNVAPSVLATIAAGQSFYYSPAPQGTVPRVTWSQAIASGASVPANVVGAQLLEITTPATNGKPLLVWAVQESLPDRGGDLTSAVLSLTGKPIVAHAHDNYQVDFVNASTGKLFFTTLGHAPDLTTAG